MIRALFVTKHLRAGGAQRNWTILLPGLAERGFAPRLITLEDQGEMYEELRSRGVPVTCAGMRGRLDLRALRHAFELGGWQPQVVVSHDERSHLVGRWLARRDRMPHVASDHGGPGFRLKLHGKLIQRLVAPGFAAAVTMSEERARDLERHGFRPDRVYVISNGVDPVALGPARSRQETRASLDIPEDAFVALMLAVLRPEKRADRFVCAVSRARAADPRVCGLIAGYGPDEGRVRQLASEAGGAVGLLGHRGDAGDLIEAADVICLTSDVEGAPYAALEAMALARPVACMDVGSLGGVVVHGQTGLLVPPGDVDGLAAALVTLARDPARAAALGNAGRDRQRELFGAARMSDSYAELLRTLSTARSSTSSSAGAATSSE